MAQKEYRPLILLVLAIVAVSVGFSGLTPVNPNEARALVLFGHYDGTVHTQVASRAAASPSSQVRAP